MHSYSVETRKTQKITFVIGLVTVGAYVGLETALKQLMFPSWIELPSVFLIFYIIFQFWNRFLWKAPIIRSITSTEYIGGKWSGKGESSYQEDDSKKEFDITIEISQTWSTIEVLLKTDSSHSVSKSAYFSKKSKKLNELVYTYQNHPNYDSENSMKIHEGTCKLKFDGDKEILEGDYYTDPNRGNNGSFRVTKENKQSYLEKISNIVSER